MRRGEGKIHYAYAFNPDFEKHFIKLDASDERIPSVIEMEVIPQPYLLHDEILKYCNKEDVKQNAIFDKMDFDFSMSEYENYSKEFIFLIKRNIGKFHNLVLIDFTYFCNAIEEKINLYKPFRYIEIDDLKLEAIVDAFLGQIISDDFDHYMFCVVKGESESKIILGFDMEDFFEKYDNCFLLRTNNFKHCFEGTVFQLIKNYYINDKFFHLDKLIIISDDFNINSIIIEIIPQFNFECDNPDIILVRNFNRLTNMDGRIRYIVVDNLVVSMLGISQKEYGELETLAY